MGKAAKILYFENYSFESYTGRVKLILEDIFTSRGG